MRPTGANPLILGWLNALRATKLHRPFGVNEERYLRLATRKPQSQVEHERNPGVRFEPGFVVGNDAQEVVEAAMQIIKQYGLSHVTDQQRDFYAQQMKNISGWPQDGSHLNMMRVTGRYESVEQKLAPWGHGDSFDPSKVPPALRRVMEKIQSCGAFALGQPRDITLNYRHSYYYRLDPHVDPEKDGNNVFILGLLSGTVITLSPPHPHYTEKQFLYLDQRRVSEQSWQPGRDVDCDLVEGGLLHLTNDARQSWNHGIRPGMTSLQLEALGVSVDDDTHIHAHTHAHAHSDTHTHANMPPGAEEGARTHNTAHTGAHTHTRTDTHAHTHTHTHVCADGETRTDAPVLHDWFGSHRNPRRRHFERLSVIFAFADP